MSQFKLDIVLQKFNRLKQELPRVLANDALRYFNQSFVKQGWDGESWKLPQRKIPGTYAYKYPKKNAARRRTRATLVESGNLRRKVATSLVRQSFASTKFVVALPYASIHNYGEAMKFGGKMPQRKFMGSNTTLRNLQITKIKNAIKSIWQA
jgi:phage gpG-like protein